MTPQQLSDLYRPIAARWEGRIPYLYLDGEQNVTIGIGHLVPDPAAATALPWDTPFDDAQFMAVKNAQPGMVASAYAPLTTCRLTDAAINSLLLTDVVGKLSQLLWLPMESMPGSCALAVLDMSFNLGVGGLRGKFPKFCAAVKAGDWASAAAECQRNGVQQERNDWTESMLRMASDLAG